MAMVLLPRKSGLYSFSDIWKNRNSETANFGTEDLLIHVFVMKTKSIISFTSGKPNPASFVTEFRNGNTF